MTFREKAFENLILKEVHKLREELKHQLLKELDVVHAEAKRVRSLEFSKEYTEVLERLDKIRCVKLTELLDVDYDEISGRHSGANSMGIFN